MLTLSVTATSLYGRECGGVDCTDAYVAWITLEGIGIVDL